jgi:hypothetical protein
MHNRKKYNVAEHWEISFFATYATLTVAAGNVSVPAQALTFVLLTLGLLGLLLFQRRVLPKQW